MADERLRYDRMVERALRGVVHDALTEVAESGLPGDHHFYVTVLTAFRGVEIPDYLRKKYPDEMTIVLQHQFYGLEVSDDRFAVTLTFGGKNERLVVPLAAITTFADPSVNFALQFQSAAAAAQAAEAEEVEAETAEPVPEAAAGETGKVITLDSFRKK